MRGGGCLKGRVKDIPLLNMVSSLCSSFVPGSLVAPGGAWTPLLPFPAALPCGGPAAVVAAHTKWVISDSDRAERTEQPVEGLMKFTVTWSFPGYTLGVMLHGTGFA